MLTALELTREEWQRYIDAARQRPLRPKPDEVERQEREQLLERVREARRLPTYSISTYGVLA